MASQAPQSPSSALAAMIASVGGAGSSPKPVTLSPGSNAPVAQPATPARVTSAGSGLTGAVSAVTGAGGAADVSSRTQIIRTVLALVGLGLLVYVLWRVYVYLKAQAAAAASAVTGGTAPVASGGVVAAASSPATAKPAAMSGSTAAAPAAPLPAPKVAPGVVPAGAPMAVAASRAPPASVAAPTGPVFGGAQAGATAREKSLWGCHATSASEQEYLARVMPGGYAQCGSGAYQDSCGRYQPHLQKDPRSTYADRDPYMNKHMWPSFTPIPEVPCHPLSEAGGYGDGIKPNWRDSGLLAHASKAGELGLLRPMDPEEEAVVRLPSSYYTGQRSEPNGDGHTLITKERHDAAKSAMGAIDRGFNYTFRGTKITGERNPILDIRDHCMGGQPGLGRVLTTNPAALVGLSTEASYSAWNKQHCIPPAGMQAMGNPALRPICNPTF